MNSRLVEMALSGVIEGQDDFPRRCSVQGELEGVRALGGQVTRYKTNPAFQWPL